MQQEFNSPRDYNMKINIFIPIWNISGTSRERLFLNTLESINRDHFKICIADFGQTGDDYSRFRDLVDSYYYEQGTGSYEKSYKINKGVEVLITDEESVFITIDADTLVPRDLLKLFDQQLDDNHKYFFGNFKLVPNFSKKECQLESHIFYSNQIQHYAEQNHACGDTWFTNKKTFDHVGGFDENFKMWGVEDIEIFQKIHKLKIPFQFMDINCAKQIHRMTEPSHDLKIEGASINSVYYYKKHGGQEFFEGKTISKVIKRAEDIINKRHGTQMA